MKNITLFAGAGFSRAISEKIKYCGDEKIVMPLANEMFNNKSSKDYLGGIKFTDHKYSKLGSYLYCTYGSRTPAINYEEVYGRLKNKNNDLAEVLEELVFEILGVTFPPVRLKCEVEQTINVCREFLLREKISQVITTNPDILLDVSIMGATEFDKDFINLFGGCAKKMFLIKVETKYWQPVLVKDKCFRRIENIKRFVKIHGSITMAIKDNEKSKIYWQSKYKWYSGISSAIYTHDGKYKRCVIPPSPAKRYKKWPWKDLMKEAKGIIEKTEKLIFYGFGFANTDKSMSKELKGPISKVKQIHVIDKNSDSMKFREKVRKFLHVKDIEFGEISEL